VSQALLDKLHFSSKWLARFCQENDITYFAVFGSVSRNEDKARSDVDFLIEFCEPKTLFDLAQIDDVLEHKTKRKVDLILKKNLKPKIKPFIEPDLVVLYSRQEK